MVEEILMRPMLARTYGPKFETFPCYCQPKLNGVRALFQMNESDPTGTFQSRDEKLWSWRVIQHLYDELAQLSLGPLVLDGELYRHGWKLQRINAAVAVNRREPTLDTPEVCFHIFDVVDPTRPFSSRFFDLYHAIQDADLPHIKAVPTALCSNRADVDLHFQMYTRLGYEGIMLRPDGPYEFGEHLSTRTGGMTQFRSKFLWKYKAWSDGEYRCVGTTQGEGKADIGIGALVLENPNLSEEWPDAPEFNVGTGFSDEERIHYMQNPPIGRLIKVRYPYLSDDGVPQCPSFLAVLE